MLNFSKAFKGSVAFICLITATLVFGLLPSCTLGLGSAVDTEAPSVVITTPTDSAISNNTIDITGTFTDDVGVKNLYIKLYNVDKPTDVLLEDEAIISGDASDGSWTYSLDTTKYTDGTYKIIAYAKDGVHTSAEIPRQFDIDNTAPIFLLTSPNSRNITSPAKFGTSINIAGEASDTHRVTEMNISVFNATTGSSITLPKSTFSGFSTAGGTNVKIAENYDTVPESNTDEYFLYKNYHAIYNATEAGTQKFYLYVSLTDAAGNKSKATYLSTDVKSYLKENAGLESNQWTVDNLRDILNNTYSGSGISSAQQSVIRNLLSGSSSISSRDPSDGGSVADVNLLAFSVNIDANPTYEIVGFNTANKWANASPASSLNIKVNAGLNGTAVYPGSLSVFVYEADSTGSKKSTTPIASFDATQLKDSTGAVILSSEQKDNKESVTSVTTETFTFTLPNKDTIKPNRYYVVEATGWDEDGDANHQNLKTSSVFGFVTPTSGEVADVAITSPEVNLYTNSKTLDLTLSGTVKTDSTLVLNKSGDKEKDSCWIIKATNVNGDSPATYEWFGYTTIDFGNIDNDNIDDYVSLNWTAENIYNCIPNDNEGNEFKAALNTGAIYKLDIKVYFENGGGRARDDRSINVDTDLPTVSFNNITPVVSVNNTDKVNGKINISAQSEDGTLQSVNVTANGTTVNNTGSNYSFKGEFDTTTITGTNTLTLVVVATDKAGNSKSDTRTYTIDQTTDAPVIDLTNADATLTQDTHIKAALKNGSAKTNIFTTSSKLTGTITDDDGLDSVKIVAVSLTDGSSTVLLDKANLDATTMYSLTNVGFDNLTEGGYDITIEVKDSKQDATGNNSTTKTFRIAVDNGAPVFGNVTPANNNYFSTKIDVKASVTDGSSDITITPVSLSAGVTSEFATKSVTSGQEWTDIVTLPINVADGNYSITYKAEDHWGQTTTYTISYKVDKTAPVISNLKLGDDDYTAPSDSNNKTWSNEAYKKFGASIKEETSGLNKVYYWINKIPDLTDLTNASGNISTAKVLSSGSDLITFTQSIQLDSAAINGNNIYFVAVDEAGNTSNIVKFSNLYVDDSNPSVKADNNAETIYWSLCPIISTGTITTGASGLKDFELKISDLIVSKSNPTSDYGSITFSAPEATAEGYKYTYTFTVSAAQSAKCLTTNAHVLSDRTYTAYGTITNEAGTKVKETLFVVNVDTTSPKVSIRNISPVVNTNQVNGKITLTGSTVETNIDTLTVNVKGTDKDGNQVTTPISYTGDVYNFTSVVDTTQYKDNSSLQFDITATDLAGNEGIATKTVIINQSSDAPVIGLSNATAGDVTIDKTTNLFTKDGKLLGSISDDDGLGTVTVAYKKATDTNWSTTKTLSATGSISASLSDIISNIEEDKYDIKITATDSAKEATGYNSSSAIYHIAVDNGAPDLTVTSEQKKYYKSGSTITVEGTAVDGADIQFSVDGTYITLDNTGKYTSGNRTFVYNKSNNKWTDTLTEVTSSKTISYKAKDVYGQETSVKTFEYYIDSAAPVIKDAGAVPDVYYNKSSQTLTVHIKDLLATSTEGGSGVESVTYNVTGATTVSGQLGKGTKYATDETYYNYSATVDLSDGINTITVSATDNAGNTSGTLATFTYKIDTSSPEITDVAVANATSSVVDGSTVYKVNSTTVDSVTVTPTVTEAGSGIKTIKVLKGKTEVSTLEVTSNTTNYTIAIPKDSIKEGDNTFTVVAYDKAVDKDGNANGNRSDYAYVYINCDTKAPTITVTSPASSIIDNKIVLSGTVSDSNGIKGNGSVQYYDTTKSKWVDFASPIAAVYDSAESTWTSSQIDTIQFTNGTTVKFRIVFEDNYGNISTDAEKSYTVDQNNDRPRIAFSTLTVDSTSNKVKNTNSISGTVEDYDGIVKGMWYITKADYDTNKDNLAYPTLESKPDYWHAVSVDGTSWTGTSVTEDGETTWYFYVIDAASTAFFTKDTNEYKRPYLVSAGSDTSVAANLKDNTDGITFRIDTHVPTMESKDVCYQVTDSTSYSTSDADWITSSSTIYAGGSQKYVFIRATATDANSIKTFKTSLDSNATVTVKDSTSTSKTVYIGPIDVSQMNSASTSVTVTAIDDFDLESQISNYIIIDNTAPGVSISYPTQDTYVTSNFEARGTFEDNAGGKGITTVKWMIPTKAQLASGTSGLLSVDNSLWTDYIGSVTTWKISFDFNKENTANEKNICKYANSTYAEETVSNSGIWKVPVYFYIEDGMGNINLKDDDADNDCVYIYVQPDADIPTAKITYPEDGVTVGGTVQIYGSASDNEAVDSVYIQIDADGDGDFDDDDYDYIYTNWYKKYIEEGKKYSKYTQLTYYTTTKTTAAVHTATSNTSLSTGNVGNADTATNTLTLSNGGGLTWGIKVSGTTSWNFAVNENGELDDVIKAAKAKDNSVESVTFMVRAVAVDNNNTVGAAWTTPLTFTINSDLPTIGTPVLKQYDGTTEVASVNYSADIWLSGSWYLEMDLTHAFGISEVFFNKKDGSSSKIDGVYAVSYNESTSVVTYDTQYGYRIDSKGSKNESGLCYHVKLPIDASKADESGNINTVMTVYDKSAGTRHSTTYTFSINIDNTPPSVYKTNNGSHSSSTDSTNSLRIMQGGYSSTGNKINGEYAITQSDYSYTIGDRVDEAGSGFSRIAFYFERIPDTVNATNKVRIYDPMLPVTDESNKIILESSDKTLVSDMTSGKVYINEDNLPVMYISGATRSSTTTITSVSINDSNVRVGSIVKIAGVYRSITGVSGTTITIDSAVDISYTSCEIVYAQIVDHLTVESAGALNSTTGNYAVINDDNDGMIETLERMGTTYSWTATINSKHIPDGPIQIHVVAFDVAGNCTHGYTTTSVQNNRPRITKVFLGTDFDGDGKYSYISDTTGGDSDGETYFGEFNYYPSSSVTNGSSDVTLASSAYVVKDGLAIVPEFVSSVNGGSGSLGYAVTYNFTNKSLASAVKYKDASGNAVANVTSGTMTTGDDLSDILQNDNGGSSVYKMTASEGMVHLTSETLKTLLGESNCSKKDTMIQISFWDKTDEMIQGYNSQNAVLNIPVVIDVVDTTPAVATVNPFYWNSNEDNSLYQNSTANGHIELESDWTAVKSTTPTVTYYTSYDGTTSGVNDGDPKVSGNIVIRGSAKDDQRLGSLQIKFGSLISDYTTVATYDKTKSDKPLAERYNLTNTDTLTSNGWQFTINHEYLSQEGHMVTWEFTVDTSKITNAAQTDVDFEIRVTDHTNKQSNYSDNSTDVSNNPTYRMDVVPYIAKIYEGVLAKKKANNWSVYGRTALGHYPIAADGTAYIYGFNLTGAYYGTTTNTLTVADAGVSNTAYPSGSDYASYKVATLPASKLSTSGLIALTVNGISTLNNVNHDYAKGNVVDSEGNAVAFTIDSAYSDKNKYCYNLQPNNDNNNILTDDVYFDVWQFNKEAAKPISGTLSDVVMKINPSSGMLGFAFSNGPLYFSMPGKTAKYAGNKSITDQEYSYVYWQGSYDFMSSVSLAYDNNGYSYATAAGGDINSSNADNFSFMTSRWGVSGASTGGSYGGANANRLEKIGQIGTKADKNDTTLYFDKTRIKSPVFATSAGSNSSTNVYLAYFDELNDEIRFRYGNFSGTSKGNINNFYDDYRNTDAVSNSSNVGSGKYDTSHVQVPVASSGTSLGNPGEYVSIAVTKDGTADKVVMVWYDSVNQKLMYAYNTNPTAGTTGTNTTNWAGTKTIFSDAGEYCQVVADQNGGIHIAAYSTSNGDLMYAYLSKYNASYNEATDSCIVDSAGIIGQNITLDVALDASGNAVPYIGYYGLSTVKPKLAYKVTSDASAAGAVNDLFTGKWEVTYIPTDSNVPQDRINVGVWKNTSGNDVGKIKNSTTGTSSASQYYGRCFGNGTSNPVLGYARKQSSTSGFIETAQKK